MSIKKLFQSTEEVRSYQADTTQKDLFEDVESARNAEAIKEQQEAYIAPVDYSKPQQFARYGSAYLYYKTAIDRILDYYPYDGSDAEINEFANKALGVDRYVFNNVYPRTNGYAIFSPDDSGNGWGDTGSLPSGYGLPSTLEHITFKGGPGTGSFASGSSLKTISYNEQNSKFQHANIYDEDIYTTAGLPSNYGSGSRESNLKSNFERGVTIEFWAITGSDCSLDHLGVRTQKQVLVDIWNGSLSGSLDYSRITIELNASASSGTSPFLITALSGTASGSYCAGIFSNSVGKSITVDTLSSWHHYALVLQNSGSDLITKFYLDGKLNHMSSSANSKLGELTAKNMKGRIGALLTAPSGTVPADPTSLAGAGKLSGSIDEFRFWKVARTAKEIGTSWFTQVRGGVNTDISNTELGLYYKFNEGITGTASVDRTVLDYGGRIANGVWTGYSSNSRNTGSAIVSASAAATEYEDPIVYASHSDVTSLKTLLLATGSYHDSTNNNMIQSLAPSWVIEEHDDSENNNLNYLSHIIGVYFDKLFLQITSLPGIKQTNYPSSSHKPLPFAEHLPQSLGLYTPELFIDASIMEKFLNRNETSLFEGDLDETKNLIYINLYNNLANIYKSKGTHRAIRNVFRCFNIDENLLKLNVYTNNQTYELKNNLKQYVTNKKFLNFNTASNLGAVVYQAQDRAHATATITFAGAASNGDSITIVDTAGTSKTYAVASATDAASGEFAGEPAGGMNGLANGLALCIANAAGHNGTITTSATATGQITLTQAVGGTAGNTTITKGRFATATITFAGAASNGDTITIVDTAGTSKTYTVASATDAAAGEFAGEPAGGMNGLANGLALCIANAAGHNGTITTSATATGQITLTQVGAGSDGNTTITKSGLGVATVVQWSGGTDTGLGVATVVQWSGGAGNDESLGYISGSLAGQSGGHGYEDKYGLTVEADITFPYYSYEKEDFPRTFLTASLFGMHTVDTGSADSKSGTNTGFVSNLATAQPDLANFQVMAIRPRGKSKNVYFQLTSSNYPYPISSDIHSAITSSIFFNVYDQERWNLSVRVKPSTYPLAGIVSGASSTHPGITAPVGLTYTYDVIFRGVSTGVDSPSKSFEVTGSMTRAAGEYFLRSAKRVYTGARRTNLTGALLNQSDVLVSSIKYWAKYLDNSDLNQHVDDFENYGISDSYRNISALDPGLEMTDGTNTRLDILNLNTLALNWNFVNVSSSGDASSPLSSSFYVTDISSGSALLRNNYGWVGNLAGYQHTGYGAHFPTASTTVVNKQLVNTYKFIDPEQAVSADMIKILSDDDRVYGVVETVPNYYYTLEKSMYGAISEEMLDFFAGVVDFNNVIGEPVNRYRERYKNLEKLREIFFRKVTTVSDVEKFIEYYKWFDDTLSIIIGQLLPASAEFSSDVYNTIESHALERNKYKTPYPTLEFEEPDLNQALEGVKAGSYDWHQGSSNITASPRDTKTRLAFWRERALRSAEEITARKDLPSNTTLADIIDSQRETIRKVSWSSPRMSQSFPTSFTDQGAVYQSREFAKRNFNKIAIETVDKIDAIGGGVNFEQSKNIHFTYDALYPAGPINLADGSYTPENVLVGFTEDVVKLQKLEMLDSNLTNKKIKRNIKVQHGRDWEDGLGKLNVRSAIAFPFNIMSSSVVSGYNKAVVNLVTASIEITNLHNDVYGRDMEVPMQGPFTNHVVGGHQSRHVPINYGSDSYSSRPEAWKLLLGRCVDDTVTSGAIGLVGADYPWPEANDPGSTPYPMTASQKAVYYRDLVAKSPVNIKNILLTSGSTPGSVKLGNYRKNYEVVSTFGAYANPRWFLDHQPVLPATITDQGNLTASSVVGTILAIERAENIGQGFKPDHFDWDIGYLVTDNSSSADNKSIITQRFGAPGGRETSARMMRDIRSGEFSVYNTLNNRNLTVIKPSQGPANTSTVTGALDEPVGIRVSDIHFEDYGLNSHVSRHSAQFGLDALQSADYLLTTDLVTPSSGSTYTYRSKDSLQGWWRLNTDVFASGDAIDSSGKDRAGSISPAGDRPRFDPYNYPAEKIQTATCIFDGTDDQIDIGTSVVWDKIIGNNTSAGSTQLMTFSAWVNVAPGSGLDRILDFGNRDIVLITHGTSKYVGFETSWNGSTITKVTANNTIETGKWHHIAVTYDANTTGNVPKIYIDGEHIAVTGGSPSGTWDGISGVNCYIGGYTAFFTGRLADIAVWNSILHLDEIKALYNFGSTFDSRPSMFKTNRNPKRRATMEIGYNQQTLDGITGSTYRYDNLNVQHPIPQMDRQYSWVANSIVKSDDLRYFGRATIDGPLAGYYSSSIDGYVPYFDYVTASSRADTYVGGALSSAVAQATTGLNTVTAEPITASSNTLGYPLTEPGTAYINRFLSGAGGPVPSLSTAKLPAGGVQGVDSADYLNLLLTRRGSSFGWNWKAFHQHDHPILALERSSASFSFLSTEDGTTLAHYRLPPVSVRGRPVLLNISGGGNFDNSTTLKATHNNEEIFFNDRDCNELLAPDPDSIVTPYEQLVSIYRGKFNWVLYSENLYPSLRNEFSSSITTRLGYDNKFWRDTSVERIALGADQKNSWNRTVSQSSWPLEAQSDWATRTTYPTAQDGTDNLALIITGKSGELQNNYFHTLNQYNDNALSDANEAAILAPGALYARKHMLDTYTSVVGPNGPLIAETASICIRRKGIAESGSWPSANSAGGAYNGFAVLPPWGYNTNAAPGVKQYRVEEYGGEAHWDAPTQAGIVSQTVVNARATGSITIDSVTGWDGVAADNGQFTVAAAAGTPAELIAWTGEASGSIEVKKSADLTDAVYTAYEPKMWAGHATADIDVCDGTKANWGDGTSANGRFTISGVLFSPENSANKDAPASISSTSYSFGTNDCSNANDIALAIYNAIALAKTNGHIAVTPSLNAPWVRLVRDSAGSTSDTIDPHDIPSHGPLAQFRTPAQNGSAFTSATAWSGGGSARTFIITDSADAKLPVTFTATATGNAVVRTGTRAYTFGLESANTHKKIADQIYFAILTASAGTNNTGSSELDVYPRENATAGDPLVRHTWVGMTQNSASSDGNNSIAGTADDSPAVAIFAGLAGGTTAPTIILTDAALNSVTFTGTAGARTTAGEKISDTAYKFGLSYNAYLYSTSTTTVCSGIDDAIELAQDNGDLAMASNQEAAVLFLTQDNAGTIPPYGNSSVEGTAEGSSLITVQARLKDGEPLRTITLTDGKARTVTFQQDSGETAAARTDANNYKFGSSGASTTTIWAKRVNDAIALAKTNEELSITSTSTLNLVSLTQDISGAAGQTEITGTAPAIDTFPTTGSASPKATYSQFAGGSSADFVWASYPSTPFYSKFDDFNDDIKLQARGYSVVPEFRISEHVEAYIKGGLFQPNKYDTFEIPGTRINSTTSSFYRDYSNSDFMTNFLKVKSDTLLGAKEIRLVCSAAIKFHPYKGFYPAQRTLDLVSQFSRSYGSGISATHNYKGGNLVGDGTPSGSSTILNSKGTLARPILQPFFAPGILYNSIKSGIAVDYPIISDPNKMRMSSYDPVYDLNDADGFTTTGSQNWAITANRTLLQTEDHTGYATGSFWDKRISFEAIIDPVRHLGSFTALDMEPHPSASINVTGSWNGQASDSVYTLMARNFFGEVSSFFLKDSGLTSLESSVIGDNMEFESGSVYMARVKLRRSTTGLRTYEFESSSLGTNDGFTRWGAAFTSGSGITTQGTQHTGWPGTRANQASGVQGWDPADLSLGSGSYPLPQDPQNNPGFKETFTMYSRPSAFGPPVAGIIADNQTNAATNYTSYATASGIYDSFMGVNSAFTPPYYDGEAWLDLIFRPDIDGGYDLERILGETKTVSWRWDPGITTGPRALVGGETGSPILIMGGPRLGVTHAANPIYAGNNINVNSMQLTHSINAFGIRDINLQERDKFGKVLTERNTLVGKQWVIQPKWETPMLNFNDEGVHPITDKAGNLTVPTYASASTPRGMWHQFGSIPPSPDKGIFLEIGDIPTDWLKNHYLVFNSASVYCNNTAESGSGAGGSGAPRAYETVRSLAGLLGFNRDATSKRLGELAESRTIREAIVAVPYIIESGTQRKKTSMFDAFKPAIITEGLKQRKKFIEIPQQQFDAASKDSDGSAAGDSLEASGESIRKLIQKMDRYSLPPEFDFVNNPQLTPIVMYMFEFKYELDRDDLSYIWQNLAPRNYDNLTFQYESVAHELMDLELLNENHIIDNENLRWMVFKVKQKAQTDYYDLIESQAGERASTISNKFTQLRGAFVKKTNPDSTYNIRFNWPYDYVSIVEQVKLDAEVLYKPDSTTSNMIGIMGQAGPDVGSIGPLQTQLSPASIGETIREAAFTMGPRGSAGGMATRRTQGPGTPKAKRPGAGALSTRRSARKTKRKSKKSTRKGPKKY